MIAAWILIILGIGIQVDGIGSILIQLKQPIIWWQFERMVRVFAGVIILAIGVYLL